MPGGRVVIAVTTCTMVGLIALIGCSLDAGLVSDWALATDMPVLMAVVAGYTAVGVVYPRCGDIPQDFGNCGIDIVFPVAVDFLGQCHVSYKCVPVASVLLTPEWP